MMKMYTFLVYIVLSTVTGGSDAYYFLDILGRMGLLQAGEYIILILYPNGRTGIANKYNASMNSGSSQYFLSTEFLFFRKLNF